MSINYAGFHYPVDLRVHQFLPRVEFAVSMKPTESCTSQRVDALERSVTDFEEALRDSIEAMQLMAIEGNDRCLKSLRKRAAKVAFDKNVRANQLSKGLVAINDALATAYEHEFQSSSVVSGQIATYRKQSIGLEAVELVAVRDEAQGRGDFATAASVQEVIAERAASDESVAEAYAAEKMGDKEIKDDSEFLESLAPETPKPEPF
jgi:thymidine phosphorylase